MSAFTSALHDISEKCIPKSSTRLKRRNPWYNDECKTAINKRKSALRKYNKNSSRENHMHPSRENHMHMLKHEELSKTPNVLHGDNM